MFNKICVLIFILNRSVNLVAQIIVPAGHEVNFTQYTSEEGMAFSSIRSIFQDNKKRIWICAKGGLANFNGKEFIYYNRKNNLTSTDICSINEDDSSRIWVGTAKGLYMLNNQKFIHADSAKGLPFKETIWSIFKDKDGSFWAGGNRAIYHFNPYDSAKPLIKKYTPFVSSDHNGIRCIKRKKTGEIFAGGDYGYFILEKDSFIKKNLPGPAYCLIELPSGKEWYSGWGSPVYQNNKGSIDSVFNLGSGILGMTTDKKGNIWLASWETGIYKYDGKKFINYSTNEGLEASSFWCNYCDKEGNVWFGCWGNGVYKYSGERFTKITQKSGLKNNQIKDAALDSTGRIWLLGENFISRYDPTTRKIINYDNYNGQTFRKIICAMVTRQNELLALTYGGGGYKIADEKIFSEPWIGGFCTGYDKFNRICFGTEGNGLAILENQKPIEYITLKNQVCTAVGVIKDTKGNLWVLNGSKGILYYDYNSTTCFDSKLGFFDTRAISIANISENNFLIGVSGRGLFYCRLNNNKTISVLDSVKTEDGLTSNSVVSIHQYKNKVLMGTSRGICVMDLKEFLNGTKKITSYVREDGLSNSFCSVLLVDKQGKAWIETDKGVYIYDTEYEQQNSVETSNLLLSVKLFYKEIDTNAVHYKKDNFGIPQNLTLPYYLNHINFDFIGICHTAQSKVKYKYRLLGLESEWCPPTNKTEMEFSGLSHGTYTFEVISSNNEGKWSEIPLTFTRDLCIARPSASTTKPCAATFL